MGYLDVRTRRRVAAGLLAAIVVLAILAATDVGPFSDPEPPPTEEEIVEGTIEDFFEAAADDDFKAFCKLMTDELQVEYQRQGAELAAEQGLEGCAEILAALYEEALRDPALEISEVSVSGPQARVEVEVTFQVAGERDRRQLSVSLLDVDGEWRVSAFD